MLENVSKTPTVQPDTFSHSSQVQVWSQAVFKYRSKAVLAWGQKPPGNDSRVITRMPPLPVQALGNQQWADAHPAALVHVDGCCDGCSTTGKILKHSGQSVGFNTHMHARMHTQRQTNHGYTLKSFPHREIKQRRHGSPYPSTWEWGRRTMSQLLWTTELDI